MKRNRKTGRLWAALLSLAMVVSMLVVPASANENSQQKVHDYLDWLEFDQEIIKVEWEAYQAYNTEVISFEPETFYRPIVYVPIGTTVQLKWSLIEDGWNMTDKLTTPVTPENGIQYLEENAFNQLAVNSTQKTKYGIFKVYMYNDGSVGVSVEGRTNYIGIKYSLYIVGVDTNATDATGNYPNTIPGLEEYVTFSNPYVGTENDTAVIDVSTDTSGEVDIKREEITVYEFPVGTKLRLTEKAIKDGYTISHIDTSAEDESEYFQTELTLSKVTTWRDRYSAHSENDPTGFTIFLRAVNTDIAFSDVEPGAYYQDAVRWAVKYGVTSGTSATTFSPAQTCTVAQIITFLWRAKGSSEPYISNPFSDVSERDYYYKAALWAEGYGVVDGSRFNPNAPCTRSMVVAYLWKMNGSPAATPSSFTDVPADADYAQAVAWAVEKGITSGTSATTFSPDSTCTRGQIATFLYRAMGK